MRTRVLPVDPSSPDALMIDEAVGALSRGELVVLPTETVYGLAAVADLDAPPAAIFAAKGRPAWNPLIVHVADVCAARALAAEWPAVADRLAARFWPGPLTLVARRAAGKVPDVVTAGGDTVALRWSSHPVMRAVLAALRRPVAAPSANRFQSVSPTTAAHALKSLAGRVPLILDAGPTSLGMESTVVDVSVDPPRVLRPGAISYAALREVAPTVVSHDVVHDESSPSPSPGTARRHYAPAARTQVVARGAVDDAARSLSESADARVGAVVVDGAEVPAARVVVRLPNEPAGYAAGLYAALHRLEDEGCTAIVVEAVPDTTGWEAVRDRLRRASA